MYYLLAFVCGVIAGAIIGALVYRNNAAKAEDALMDARLEIESLKKRVGGK